MTTMTTDTMTADEAQRLLDGATPGEWGAYRPSEYPKDFRLASMQGLPVRYVGRLTCSHPNEPHPTKGDAALCAAAPRLAASVVALHAEVAALRKRAHNAEAMRDMFVGAVARLASTDEALAATEAQQERDALRAQLAQVTAERDALRELLADVESGEAPTCEEHGDGTTLATQLDDAGNPVCDEHSDGIVCRRDLPHADVIRTLPRGR